jgi:predicted SprT family Zn-dependent metalloprotease
VLKTFRNINHVEIIAKLLIEHEWEVDGVRVNIYEKGYKFKWDKKAVRRFGQCRYSKREIGLSLKPTEANYKEYAWKVQDTILHEIAHAIEMILYHTKGHREDWKRIAKQIGCDGKMYYDQSKINCVRTKWSLKCPVCNRVSPRVRKPKNPCSCGTCTSTYDPRYKMELIQNY